ncbi:hypothetical protein PHYSODRAFT_477168 [Phytophthora sojae]|uniref:Uncharacterized protein n=1 Tax=Phytophthora sojae (strain P6497) TaxID=1094619 RepID=G4YGN1_PHYSP|nr:hypothetical protein PHYSODRAFT_477168 [Phytophthora sojae]EGZ26994.1 hypothetical protein PHYSODRAFT_477168 [Phytophthora sojae]|eukprot:XP_009514269.1 hypothetical protein PHYSODRAFT_477168 [Phytophthora sojae]
MYAYPLLTASEMQPESLHAGEMIEYFTMALVSGDPRGHREAKVLRVSDDADFPIDLDTGEKIPLTMKIRRIKTREGPRIDKN